MSSIAAPTRRLIGRAIGGSLLVGFGFVAFTLTAKEVPSLYVHEPWQDDPYDAVVSFAIIAVSLLTGAGATRAALGWDSSALPARRVVDLLRAGRLNLLLVATTLASDWISLALRAHRDLWTGTTALVTAGLVAMSLLTGGVAVLLRRASHATTSYTTAPDQPDWAADAVECLARATGRLGRWQRPALAAVQRLDSVVVCRVRQHPLAAAALFAVLFGAFVDAPQIVIEGYPPALAVLFITITACSLFAFVAIVGATLRLVGRRAAHATPVARVLVLVALSVPLAASFRGSLWWVVGTNARAAGLPKLSWLLAVCASATAAVAVATQALTHTRAS